MGLVSDDVELEGGGSERRFVALTDILGESYPAHMNLPQQGSFNLGYYHQTQKRYEKKEEK